MRLARLAAAAGVVSIVGALAAAPFARRKPGPNVGAECRPTCRPRPVGPIQDAAVGPAGLPGSPRLPYLPGVDGLRAVAVMAVLLYHADLPWIRGGLPALAVSLV